MKFKIYVMDRGFVLVGSPREPAPDPYRTVFDALAVVRLWGTERGIGQLATEGPTDKTVVDPEPKGSEIANTYVMRECPCSEEANKRWTTLLRSSST